MTGDIIAYEEDLFCIREDFIAIRYEQPHNRF